MASGSTPTMDYTYLGRSGLEVSNICLGTMTFGSFKHLKFPGLIDEEASHTIMDRYEELGGNFLDTANVYTEGRSEEIIGTWIQKRQNRDKMVVATKVRFHPTLQRSEPNMYGLGRKHIISSVEASLERLQTNYIDLYQTHCWDADAPLEETMRTLHDLVRCGKVRYLGASNMKGWQLQRAVDTCDKWGFSPFISLQQQYSLNERNSETEVFEVCENHGLGILAYSPLKGGLLSGKFKREMTTEEAKKTDSRVGWATETKFMTDVFPDWEEFRENEKFLHLLDTLHEVAGETGRSAAQVSVRWLLQKKAVASVIVGARKISQLEDNVGASSGWQLSAEQMARLDEASAPQQTYPYTIINNANKARMPSKV